MDEESINEGSHQTEQSGKDDFCFENDAPELKANEDYRKLMETIMKLIYLRADTIQKTEHIFRLIRELKNDPDTFIDDFMGGKIELPSESIPVPKVPEVDFSKFVFPKNDVNGEVIAVKQLIFKYEDKDMEHQQTEDRNGKKKVVVRGREYDESKPQTFNQLWTAEEQLRLEELLVKYPPERKESCRWVKIAAALGNRTPKQVCSRVQKYFLKLRKMGFSVPGRNPRSSQQKNKGRTAKKNFIDKNTTFFPKIETSQSDTLSLATNEDRMVDSVCGEHETSECFVKSDLKEADWLTDSKRFEILLRIKSDKEKKRHVIRHFNVTCSKCGESPIVDTRWTCSICSSVDFCSDCMIDMLNNREQFSNHPASHRLDLVDSFDGVRDPDYFPHKFNSANYLDPNFILH